MISISDVATQMSVCKIMAMALPRFYRRTKISAQFAFKYNHDIKGVEIEIGFLPREATENEYSILFEELMDAEQILLNEYIVNNTHNYENIKQFHSKHKEEFKQIIERQKQTLNKATT
jgi:hypothetical protein